MKLAAVIAATAAAVAVPALSAATASAGSGAGMTLTCKVGGKTVVHNITDDESHFRFQWWYANGSTYKSPVWVYYTNATSKGTLFIPTHRHPVRAMATEHRHGGGLVRIRAACS